MEIMKGYKVRQDNGERCPSNLTVSIPITDQKLEKWINSKTFKKLLEGGFNKFDCLTNLFYNPDLDEDVLRKEKLTYEKIIDDLEMEVICLHGFRFCWIPVFSSSRPVQYHDQMKSWMDKVRLQNNEVVV
jgi:hypothetical protein